MDVRSTRTAFALPVILCFFKIPKRIASGRVCILINYAAPYMKNLYLLLILSTVMVGCNSNQSPTGAALPDRNRPNIIYIYADDLGYGETGPYGQKKIETPNLDKMAAEGMRFTQHYTSVPVCAPARCALMTGKHLGHAYIRGNRELGEFSDDAERGQWPLAKGTVTIGTLLQNAGYVTGAIGKWGMGFTGNSGHPNKQGFDYFYGYLDQKQAHNYYPTHLWENTQWDTLDNAYIYVHTPRTKDKTPDADGIKDFANSELEPGDPGFFEAYKGKEYAIAAMGRKVEDFIRTYKDSAFFLYLPFTIPHVSLQVPDSALQQYLGRFDEEPYLGEKGYAPHQYPLSAYAAMISYLDSEVGRVFSLLKALGLDENTIVMFSSDNGPTFNGGTQAEFFNSTAGFRGMKMDVYEGGIREPMLARWPGKIKAGTTTDHLSAQYDVMATVADLVGIKAPDDTDGISFLPTLLGKGSEQQQHDFLYFEYHAKGGQLAVRKGPWKGVKTGLERDPSRPWELYNLEKDPFETDNVATDHPDILKQLDEIAKTEHESSIWENWNFMDRVVSGER